MFLPGGLPVTDGKTRRPPAGDIAKSNLYSVSAPTSCQKSNPPGKQPFANVEYEL